MTSLKVNDKILYFLLIIFAVYFTNNIYGKFVLILLITYFLVKLVTEKYITNIKILPCVIGFFLLFLSNTDKLFLIGFPILFTYFNQFEENEKYTYWLLNTLLCVTIIENLYFTGINLSLLFYFWGLPIICLTCILTLLKKKEFFFILNVGIVITMIFQGIFLFRNYNQTIYTHSKNNSIVANYQILNKYFSNVINLNNYNTVYLPKSTVLLPICENKNLNNINFITGNTYILLGEHDNLNGFLEKYPYFNNDRYARKNPWELFIPNMISSLKYVTHKDIFYCSNIGSTVKLGYPLIWDYTAWGKPILLATFTKINGANVYLFGDSDPFVNKLIPYNINFVSILLNRGISFYPLFITLFILINILLSYKKIKYTPYLYILMILIYFLPLYTNIQSELKVYSQVKYLTAHEKSYPSSILNKLAERNISVIPSSKTSANIIVINKKLKINNKSKHKLYYLMPNANIKFDNIELYCTGIKTGEEIIGNTKNINSNLLMMNRQILNTSILQKNDNYFVCTGSPQLNENLTRSILLNDK